MRLITDGAEYQDMLGVSAFVGASINTTTKRSGTASYSLPSASNYVSWVIAASGEVFVRCPVYFSVLRAGWWLKLQKGSTDLCTLVHDGTRFILRLGNESGSILITGANLYASTGVWIFLELRYKIDNTVGAAEIRVNGLSEGTFSGDTQIGSDTTADNFKVTQPPGNQSDCFIDDIGLNNTDNSDGLGDISWLGEGKIELLVPSGNSPDGGWTDDYVGSDADSTNNYALVDEVPPNSADYVEDSTPGNQDRYALTDFSGTGKQILRVWVEGRALDTVPEGAQMKLGLRLAGADYMSAAISLSSVYTSIKGTQYKQNPATGPADWVDSDLDGAQIILETV